MRKQILVAALATGLLAGPPVAYAAFRQQATASATFSTFTIAPAPQIQVKSCGGLLVGWGLDVHWQPSSTPGATHVLLRTSLLGTEEIPVTSSPVRQSFGTLLGDSITYVLRTKVGSWYADQRPVKVDFVLAACQVTYL